MNFIKTFFDEYATTVFYAIITAIIGAMASFAKRKYTEWENTKTKKETVKTVVYAMQQLYKDLDGAGKKAKAIEQITAILNEKGISISELEINMLIEACVGEVKDAFSDVCNVVEEDEMIAEDLTF